MPNSDVIQIMCPRLTCRRILAVPARARGKLVRCRGCGSTIRVPVTRSGGPESPDAPGAPASRADGGADQSGPKAA